MNNNITIAHTKIEETNIARMNIPKYSIDGGKLSLYGSGRVLQRSFHYNELQVPHGYPLQSDFPLTLNSAASQ